MSKTVIEMAQESGADTMLHWDRLKLERFAALVRADERNSWPAEMEAMERQVNILTDALAKQAAQQEHVADALIRQYINALVSNKPDEAANVTKAMVDYVYTTPQAQPAPEIAIADAYRAGVDSGIAAERERCCAIVFGLCESDNVAQRTVDAIRAMGDT